MSLREKLKHAREVKQLKAKITESMTLAESWKKTALTLHRELEQLRKERSRHKAGKYVVL